MNTQFDKLDDFIFYLRSYAVEYFDESSITFQFHSPATIPEITLSGELRRNIFLCIKEALNNIVKHSGATEASLTFSVVSNTLITEIKDNGIGINTTRTSKFGNGLNTMKERLQKFGSHLEIEVNNGTKLVFKINIIAQ
jgi:signal transduction histidine kinase